MLMQLLHAHSTTVLAQARPTMFCIRLVYNTCSQGECPQNLCMTLWKRSKFYHTRPIQEILMKADKDFLIQKSAILQNNMQIKNSRTKRHLWGCRMAAFVHSFFITIGLKVSFLLDAVLIWGAILSATMGTTLETPTS